MSAAPRGVAANVFSAITTSGRRRLMTSRARSASTSANVSSSALGSIDFFSPGNTSGAPMSTIQGLGLLKEARVLNRPPPYLYFADDVLLGYLTPVAAIGAVVAVIAHDEVVALLHDLRAPIVVAAKSGWHVVIAERTIVHVHPAVDDSDSVPFLCDHALYEHLFGIDGVIEHHDVARPRFSQLVHELADDEPVVILECRLHAHTIDARDLKSERHDEGRIDCR